MRLSVLTLFDIPIVITGAQCVVITAQDVWPVFSACDFFTYGCCFSAMKRVQHRQGREVGTAGKVGEGLYMAGNDLS